ncbi:hypothetical protein CH341_10750 [Rhodoplanes roseus]|uniref:Uncharacterized protein n=1 Tax=Rhodoplanes roseus TaxID=29409 RepID=A0A327L3N7_9BRAD|nr:hypothetical protein CH341_10750 [Rhodoplanes roseus]
MKLSSIYPLDEDRPYAVGDLRKAEAALLAERQADRSMSSRSRVQDRKIIKWAKPRVADDGLFAYISAE